MNYVFNLYCYYTGSRRFNISRERALRLMRHARETGQFYAIDSTRGIAREYGLYAGINGSAYLTVTRAVIA